MRFIENRTFDELTVGEHAEITRTLGKQDIELFAVMSGDVNPARMDEEFAKSDQFHKVIAHGMWGGALISAVLGTELPESCGTTRKKAIVAVCAAATGQASMVGGRITEVRHD